MKPPRFAHQPEPTDWCNVRFAVAVDSRDDAVIVWLGWENDLALDAEDIGKDDAKAAFQFVDAFRRAEVLEVHRLLTLARQAYERSGEKESIGHIPSATILSQPRVVENAIEFAFELEGQPLIGKLSSELIWTCDRLEPLLWSTAKHAAIHFALSNLGALEAAGFDTSAFRRSSSQ